MVRESADIDDGEAELRDEILVEESEEDDGVSAEEEEDADALSFEGKVRCSAVVRPVFVVERGSRRRCR